MLYFTYIKLCVLSPAWEEKFFSRHKLISTSRDTNSTRVPLKKLFFGCGKKPRKDEREDIVHKSNRTAYTWDKNRFHFWLSNVSSNVRLWALFTKKKMFEDQSLRLYILRIIRFHCNRSSVSIDLVDFYMRTFSPSSPFRILFLKCL